MAIGETAVKSAVNKRVKRRKRGIQWSAYGYLAPALISICVLSLAPMLYTIWISFTNWNAQHFMNYSFIGLSNYRALLNPNDPLNAVFVPTFIWTIMFAFLTTVINYFAGLLLAVLLNNKNIKEAALYRSLLIIPWAVPGLISLLSWQGLLNQSYGQINAALHLVGISPVPWLVDPFWARVSILMVNLWASYPYMMTVCTGALQSVPEELYEAAEIDGANWWQRFRFISMPSVWKVSLPLLIPSFAYSFNNFNAVYLLTGGGPARNSTPFAGYTDILASAAYKMTLTYNRYDYAATLSVILFILVGLISWLNMQFTGAFKEAD